MTKQLLTAFLLAVSVAISADAKTVRLPDADEPIASITFPDDWKLEDISGGVAADSPDEHVYISAVVVKDETDINAEIDDVFKMLKEHNVELDESTKKENKFKINSLEAEELLFQGKDEDGPCGVSITFVPIKNDLVILTYWVTTAEEAKHQGTVGKIVRSLKPTR
jgi:hypothetical protein